LSPQKKSVTFHDQIANEVNNPIEINQETTAEQPDIIYYDIINYGEGTNPEQDGPDADIDGEVNNADPDEREVDFPMEHNDANLPNSRETDSIPVSRETDGRAPTRSRYGRIIKQTTRMIESREQARTRKNHNIALCSSSEDYNKSLHIKHNEITNSLENPMAFISQVGDRMHLHQAMKQPDRAKFLKAMEEEVSTHEKSGHWKIIPISAVPDGERILDSVWAIRRKMCIGTGEIRKYKARLKAHGGQQVYGVNYWETYAPVVKWTTIRLVMTLIMSNEWKSRQLDFVLAYQQANVEGDIYMRMPHGFKLNDGRDRKSHVLKLIKNIYGLKQAGRVWNQHLDKGMTELGYRKSKIDPCLYYQKGSS